MLIRYFGFARTGLVALGFTCCFVTSAFGQTASAPAGQAAVPAAGPTVPAVVNNQATSDHIALMHLIESIDPYHKQKEIKGSAVLSGSTTMMAIGKSWADRFRKFHPEVTLTRGVDGTEAAIKALSEDANVIAGSSRPLSDAEVAMLKNGKCKEPLSVIVALDPLALYVHRDNPIAGVTPQQLESIFRASGTGQHAATWGDLGLTGDWAKKPIQIQARSETSGTTTFIKQLILQGGEMAKPAKTHKTNDEVCVAVGSDTSSVGVCGFGEATDKVRAVPLLLNGLSVPANEQSFLTGQYPFVRPLVLVVDKAQMKVDGGLREAVLRYILSRDGQMEAVREGFYPIDPAFIRQQLDQISGPQMR
jgi:phosphate transport system substrate-binding protein